MGKQINFYMSETVQDQFLEYLKQEKFQFLDNSSNKIDKPGIRDVFGMYLYKPEYGETILHSEGRVELDSIKSPVIEYSKTIIKEEYRKVLRGRLWICTQYYAEDGSLTQKPEQLLKEYQRLVRWIKKNVPYQEIKTGNAYIKEYVSDEMKQLQEDEFRLTL